MAGYSAVSFVGAQAVVQAYQYRKVPAWAIFCGKDLMFTYNGDSMAEGLEQLETILEALSQSNGCYMLKVYEDLQGKISDKTPAHGSFTFAPKSREGASGVMQYQGAQNYEMMHLLKDMQKQQAELMQKVAHLEEDTGDDEEEQTGVGKIVGVVKQIAAIDGIGDIVRGIFSRPQISHIPPYAGAVGNAPSNHTVFDSNRTAVPQTQQQQPATSVAQPQEPTGVNPNITDKEAEDLGRAYVIIRHSMPDALQMLTNLSDIALHNPEKFAGIKSAIKMFM